MEARRKIIQTISAFLLKTGLAVAVLSGSAAHGVDISPSQTRISSAGDKFDGVTQFGVTVATQAPKVFSAHHAEIAIGVISATGDSEMFASFGPVWRLGLFESDLFVDIGIAPTVISGTRFGGRDLGGHLHFTSSISLGKRLGKRNFVALRVQHLSNGGLNTTNPGMDMIGLEFSIRFSD